MSTKEVKLVREVAPVFSTGFRMGVGDGMSIIDFVDAPEEHSKKIIFSIALTKKQAKNLAEQLNDFVNSEDSDD